MRETVVERVPEAADAAGLGTGGAEAVLESGEVPGKGDWSAEADQK